MTPQFFDELESEMVFESPKERPGTPSASVPAPAQKERSVERPRRNHTRSPKNPRHPSHLKNVSADPRKHPFQKGKNRQVPKNVAIARSAAADSGVLVVVFLAESTLRAMIHSPRIESRGFFLPHEIRDGHKFLVSESRRSYEETLKDVPDIETKDLEKIIKKDLEKAVSERFSRSPLIIATVLIA